MRTVLRRITMNVGDSSPQVRLPGNNIPRRFAPRKVQKVEQNKLIN